MEQEADDYIHTLHCGKTFSKCYSLYRPLYPDDVYQKIMGYHVGSGGGLELAVDACCGSGQSSIPLTEYFEKVVGVDTSLDQLTAAPTNVPRLTFYLSLAEEMSFLRPNSVDLVTIAAGLHWVNHNNFYKEVQRVLKPGGTLAAYCYDLETLDNKRADRYIQGLRRNEFSKYMTSRADIVFSKYRSIPFPFTDIKRYDHIPMSADLTIDEYIGYLSSFHYVKEYQRDNQDDDILSSVRERLTSILTDDTSSECRVTVTWDLFLVLGRSKKKIALS
ncbi:putative methyltransferase DDB_G0268948 [Physella acuta]|uniref:putative methyltransferase DDB_G0268948 n=1 Tax=Physella acuta TaxID=109671 RepID=UPI0027DB13C7|nr:putative methyltransferase DDB_G0268948 [Physella acuta]